MILLILIIFVLSVWFINKLLFGELYGGSDDDDSAVNEARHRQQQQFHQYQQFQQREYERHQNRHYYDDGPIIIEKADAPTSQSIRKRIGDYGEYVEFREVEE